MIPSHRILCDTGDTYKNKEGDDKTKFIEMGILFPGKGAEDIDFSGSGYVTNFPIDLFKQNNKINLFIEDRPEESKRPSHSIKVVGKQYTGDDKKKHNEMHEFATIWVFESVGKEGMKFHGFGTIKNIPAAVMKPGNKIVIFPITKKSEE